MAPQPGGQEPPEEDHGAPAPVDDAHVSFHGQRPHDLVGHKVACHGHGEMAALDEVGVYKARPDVGEADVQFAGIRQLLEGLDISVLKGLGGTVRRRRSQPARACNAGDDRDVSAAVVGHPPEGLAHHACEAQGIGADGVEFGIGLERGVLPSDARGVEIEV